MPGNTSVISRGGEPIAISRSSAPSLRNTRSGAASVACTAPNWTVWPFGSLIGPVTSPPIGSHPTGMPGTLSELSVQPARPTIRTARDHTFPEPYHLAEAVAAHHRAHGATRIARRAAADLAEQARGPGRAAAGTRERVLEREPLELVARGTQVHPAAVDQARERGAVEQHRRGVVARR